MSHIVSNYIARAARVDTPSIGGARTFLTVGHVRLFLAEVAKAGIGDDARVSASNTHIEAWQTESTPTTGDVDAD